MSGGSLDRRSFLKQIGIAGGSLATFLNWEPLRRERGS